MHNKAESEAPVALKPWSGAAPRHVGIIMDGNGRWAAARGLPRFEGHRRGVEAVRRSVRAASRERVPEAHCKITGVLWSGTFSSMRSSRKPRGIATACGICPCRHSSLSRTSTSTVPGLSIIARASSIPSCLIVERASSRIFFEVFAINFPVKSVGGFSFNIQL